MTTPDHENETQALLERTYGFRFPPDFFVFWDFFNTHSSLLEDADIGMRLIGPFNVLRDPASAHENLLTDARYYNDPPEFVTVATGDTDGLHWGYYLDDPKKPPFALASYFSNDAFELSVTGYTLFEALRHQIELLHQDYVELLERESSDPEEEDGEDDDEEEKEEAMEKLDQLDILRKALQDYATGDRLEVGEEYISKYAADPNQDRQPVAATRDYMGIVVPAELYTPLTGEDIFQIWNVSPSPQDVQAREEEAIRLLQQGSPGAALKLGKDLWIFKEFRQTSYSLLEAAYSALDRPLLQRYLQIAISYRADCDSR